MAEAAGAHLGDQEPGTASGPQRRQGGAEFVVVRARAAPPSARAGLSTDASRSLVLGLARGAGDPDHAQPSGRGPVDQMPGQPAQGNQRVGDHDAQAPWHGVPGDGGGRTGGVRGGYEGMTVGPGPGQGDEEPTGPDGPGVRADRGDRHRRITRAGQFSTQNRSHLGDRKC